MRYSVEWQEDTLNAAPEERVTVADFRIWLNEQNVSMHMQGTHNIDHVSISLYALAEGLVHDWWTLFGARDRQFSLMRYRAGYVVPDIRLKFDGAVFEIGAYQRAYRRPEVRFWAGSTEAMTRSEAEVQIEKFIQDVLDRLDRKDVQNSSAALRWARVQASRGNAGEAVFCEAAGALDLDPYQIAPQDAASIEDAASVFKGEPLSEFLAGAAGADRAQLVHWIRDAERRPKYMARITDLCAASQQVKELAPARHLEQSWSLGYRRARAMRHVLCLQSSDRFRSFRILAKKLGASNSYTLAKSVDGIRALRSDHSDGTYIHMRSHGSSSHLFSFARAIGDSACFPDPTIAPINELHSAYRQAAGRAFAAEFIAPIDEIQSMREDGRDIVSIAGEFTVSTTVIERQIENAERIKDACT